MKLKNFLAVLSDKLKLNDFVKMTSFLFEEVFYLKKFFV